MKSLSQHISALVLLAFVAMVTDAFTLYQAAASDSDGHVLAVDCHSAEIAVQLGS